MTRQLLHCGGAGWVGECVVNCRDFTPLGLKLNLHIEEAIQPEDFSILPSALHWKEKRRQQETIVFEMQMSHRLAPEAPPKSLVYDSVTGHCLFQDNG